MKVSPSLRSLAELLDDLAEHGECKYDPELHAGPDAFTEESPHMREAREAVAAEVCESCPVWDLCLDYALRVRPSHGVWAGLRARELAALRRAVRTVSARPELGEVA